MKTTKIITLAGACSLILANGVSCLKAQTPVPAYYNTPTRSYLDPPTGKVYVGFDAGAAFQQPINLYDSIGDNEKVTFGTGVRLDCQFGYNFTPNWAAELETGLIINPVKNSLVLGTDFMMWSWWRFRSWPT